MAGYVGDKQETSATLKSDGWLKTGDLCYFDSDGFLFIVDRLKELIKHKAYQVILLMVILIQLLSFMQTCSFISSTMSLRMNGCSFRYPCWTGTVASINSWNCWCSSYSVSAPPSFIFLSLDILLSMYQKCWTEKPYRAKKICPPNDGNIIVFTA